MDLKPGASNIVPETAFLTLDLRDISGRFCSVALSASVSWRMKLPRSGASER
jgi:hypothetical protein